MADDLSIVQEINPKVKNLTITPKFPNLHKQLKKLEKYKKSPKTKKKTKINEHSIGFIWNHGF